MSHFDTILETENDGLIEKVIEDSTYDLCIENPDMIQDVEDYIDLLESDDYSPTDEFHDYISEALSPYLEDNSKYLGLFLEFDSDADHDKEFNKRANDKQVDAANQRNTKRAEKIKSNRDTDRKMHNDKSEQTTYRRDFNKRVDERKNETSTPPKGESYLRSDNQKQLNKTTRWGDPKKGLKINHNILRNVAKKYPGIHADSLKDATKHIAKGGLGSAMKRGVEKAKIKVGNVVQKVGAGKSGILGKVSAAGSKLKTSGKRGLVNVTRKNLGLAKR